MCVYKIQCCCLVVGFDWILLGLVFDKVYEEIDEVMYEVQQVVVDEVKLEEEVGDLLFVMVNLFCYLGVKVEVVLQKVNFKFECCFCEVECIVVV